MSRVEVKGNAYTGTIEPGPTVFFDTVALGMDDCARTHVTAHSQRDALADFARVAREAFPSPYNTSAASCEYASTDVSAFSATTSVSNAVSEEVPNSDMYFPPAASWMEPPFGNPADSMMFDSSQPRLDDLNFAQGGQQWGVQPSNAYHDWQRNAQSFNTNSVQVPQPNWSQNPSSRSAQSLGAVRR